MRTVLFVIHSFSLLLTQSSVLVGRRRFNETTILCPDDDPGARRRYVGFGAVGGQNHRSLQEGFGRRRRYEGQKHPGHRLRKGRRWISRQFLATDGPPRPPAHRHSSGGSQIERMLQRQI